MSDLVGNPEYLFLRRGSNEECVIHFQTPEMLASAGVQRSVTEKEKDERYSSILISRGQRLGKFIK